MNSDKIHSLSEELYDCNTMFNFYQERKDIEACDRLLRYTKILKEDIFRLMDANPERRGQTNGKQT